MAKFLVTSGSYFQPFTYDELAKPLEQMAEAQNAAQDAYDTLSSETEALRQYVMQEPEDSRARQMYNDYSAKLSALQENLWGYGYTPQTRRDLSVARAGYASDINRLGTAIKTRQDRSAEYWKTKHDHPDMIMGADPGIESLDKYLENDRFGQDYYSYSGDTFTEEVAADAKARIKEMFDDPEILNKYPQLAGYIPILKREGFKSSQVEAAALAVREAYAGNTSLLEKLDPASSVLASVLSSHLDSTGAAGNVDPNEFSRLIDYGRAGLAHAIGDSDIQYLKDNEYAYNQELRLAQAKADIDYNNYVRKKNYDNAQAAAQAGQQLQYNTGETITLRSPGYDDFEASTRNEAKHFRDGSKTRSRTIRTPDGKSKTFNNEYDLTSEIYETPERQRYRQLYGGFDIALDPGSDKNRQKFTVNLRDGSTRTVEAYKMKESEAKERGLDPKTAIFLKEGDVVIEDLSREFSNARRRYFERVEQYKADNPGIDKMTISPEKQAKLRKDNSFPSTASWDDFYSYMITKETYGDFSPAILATTDSSHDYVRTDLGRAVIREFKNGLASEGKITKGSRYAIHEVGPGGMTMSQEGIQDIGAAVGRDKNGNLRDDTITNMSATLEDLAQDRPRIRFQTSESDKVYSADAAMFGSLVDNALNSPMRGGMSASRIIRYVMGPIFHPESAWYMSDEEARAWSRDCYNLLGGDFPTVKTEDGRRYMTPLEIVRNKAAQNALRMSVLKHIADPTFKKIREAIGINHEQVKGNTNAKVEAEY